MSFVTPWSKIRSWSKTPFTSGSNCSSSGRVRHHSRAFPFLRRHASSSTSVTFLKDYRRPGVSLKIESLTRAKLRSKWLTSQRLMETRLILKASQELRKTCEFISGKPAHRSLTFHFHTIQGLNIGESQKEHTGHSQENYRGFFN